MIFKKKAEKEIQVEVPTIQIPIVIQDTVAEQELNNLSKKELIALAIDLAARSSLSPTNLRIAF